MAEDKKANWIELETRNSELGVVTTNVVKVDRRHVSAIIRGEETSHDSGRHFVSLLLKNNVRINLTAIYDEFDPETVLG